MDDTTVVGVLEGFGGLDSKMAHGAVIVAAAAGLDGCQCPQGGVSCRIAISSSRGFVRVCGTHPFGIACAVATDVGQSAIERGAFNILHGVVMNAAFATDRKDGNDVWVVQLGCGPGLVLESDNLFLVEDGRERQGLESHAAIERDLVRLVDDTHPSPSNFTNENEVAEPLFGGQLGSCWRSRDAFVARHLARCAIEERQAAE